MLYGQEPMTESGRTWVALPGERAGLKEVKPKKISRAVGKETAVVGRGQTSKRDTKPFNARYTTLIFIYFSIHTYNPELQYPRRAGSIVE